MPQLPPPDPQVPALEVLLGDGASDVLSAAGAADGFSVEEATPSQVRYSPGRSVVVQYRTRLREADGKSAEPMLVATSGITVPEATRRVRADDIEIAVWRFPRDPFLPGLASAVDPRGAAQLLTRLGAAADSVSLRARAYRATRRAVVEARSDAGTVFMKVLRPSRIEALHRRHRDLAPHLPIPHSLGWSRKLGIVAMQALGGQTLRQGLEAGRLELPSPQALVALLDQFPEPRPQAPVLKGAFQRAAEHARLIGTVLPQARPRLTGIVTAVEAADLVEAPVAVHGDFHSSQVLIENGCIVGLVDVDTAGAGQRTDDLANMIGQLATLALVSKRPQAIHAYIAELMDEFSRQTDPRVLRLRIAAVILGLATGPFRVQLVDWARDTLERLELAALWIAAADSREIPRYP